VNPGHGRNINLSPRKALPLPDLADSTTLDYHSHLGRAPLCRLVHYELQNKGKGAVKGVFLKVIFFNQSGKVTGGEVFLEHMNVKSHHHAIFQTALGQYAGEDIATVGIAIAAVNSVNNHWKDMTPTNQLVDQMKE
jgi:hypothetical protein